jgi:hypothetical protein
MRNSGGTLDMFISVFVMKQCPLFDGTTFLTMSLVSKMSVTFAMSGAWPRTTVDNYHVHL